jgi:hypothetical protein
MMKASFLRMTDGIKHPKGKGKGIMVSEFLLPWSRLNLLSFPKEQQGELIATGVPLEVVEYFKYGQEEGHWDGSMLLSQLKTKAIPIAEALYPGCQFLFLFDNATSHSVYAHDALIAKNMNKGEGGEQPLLRNGWYDDGNRVVAQEMFYNKADPSTGTVIQVPKWIQRSANSGQVMACFLNTRNRDVVRNLAKNH